MWIAYGWSIWVAGGIDPRSSGIMIGHLPGIGYFVAGSLFTPSVVQDGEWERLVSAIFLHYGFIHILMNSAAILQLGHILEAFTTRGRCWFTLLLSGLCGSLATVIWAQVTGEPNNAVGASGAGCGVGAALIVLSRGIGALTEFRKQMITWVMVMLLMGLIPMISGTGHFGGAIGGALAGGLIARRGSVQLARDRYARGLHFATVVLTALFAAALALDAFRAQERKADVAAIEAAIDDVHIWLDRGTLPDVREWVERVEGLKLPTPLAQTRDELVERVKALGTDGAEISRADADRMRIVLNDLSTR